MVPWSLSIVLLASQQQHDAITTRRCFLSSSTAACVANYLLLRPPPACAQDQYGGVSSSPTTSEPLYLARPIGISFRDGKNYSDTKDDTSVARPSAPIEFLLPATRVGLYIYQLLSIAEELARIKNENSLSISSSPAAAESSLIERLDNLLISSPPSFIKSSDPNVTRGDPYNNMPPLLGEIAVQQQKQKQRKEQFSTRVGITPQLFEVGELMGERRQWNRLVQAEKAREERSEIRRAFNIYTTNLNYNPNKYVYSGSREEKKKLIREGRLPSATDVIRSDLDARDLYRNVVQTALDDAKAEFLYQKRVSFEDVSELVRLLNDAKVAVDLWFGFIPDEDVKLAIDAVRKVNGKNNN